MMPNLTFLSGGGEMGELVRVKDWSKTPLGPIETWPQSLRLTVSLALSSNFPLAIVWGPDRVQIYNDGYWPICGAKHPHSMGQDFKECWFSAWPVIGEAFERASSGETCFLVNQRIFIDRLGYLEETFFTFSFSPIRDESGGVGGLFHPVTEITQESLAERRLRVLRDLADRSSNASSIEEGLALIAHTLEASELDVPFALFYRLDAEGQNARLITSVGLERGSVAAPESVALHVSDQRPWPLAEAIAAGKPFLVEDLARRIGAFRCRPYDEPPRCAMIQPIRLSPIERPFGFLVTGISSRRPLDEPYRTFYAMLGQAVGNALTKVHAYEEERKRAEALAELDRAKTVFFSNVSHELRTPLTLMLAPLEQLKAEFGRSTSALDAAQYQQVDLVHRNGLRLLKLVNQLLDFSRIEAGRAQALYEETDLASFTAELASVFRSAIEKTGLSLIVDCPPLPEPVFVDRDMWEKIVLNLLSNAFKFTFDGEIEINLRETSETSGTNATKETSATGEISQSSDSSSQPPVSPFSHFPPVSPAPRCVTLRVRDTGVGIPADELPRMFERFHRIAGSQGRTHEGTGIGLSLVQELARLHGGSISVDSVYGKGSTFRVVIPLGKSHLPHTHIGATRDKTSTALRALPFVEEAARWLPATSETRGTSETGETWDEAFVDAPLEQVEPVAPVSPTRPRVLLADDNADMREYLSRLLSSQGYEVEAVSDGQAALEAACANHPDLVLTDIMMPRLDGFGLLKALRADERMRAFPVIMLSARAGEESRIEGLEHGADDYLIKPFSARELLARVRSQLDLAKLRREHEERISGILNSLTDGFQTVNADYRFSYFNPAARRTFVEQGMNPDELIGRHIFDEVFPAERDKPWAVALRRAMVERVPTEVETFYALWQRWFDARYYPAPDGGVSVFFQDITERKQAEEALRESEEETKRARDYAEATLRTSPVPLLVLDHDLRVNTANEAFYETFQVNPVDVHGRLVYELGNDQWNIPKLRELLEHILPQRTVFRDFEVTHDFDSIGRRTMLLNARRMESELDRPERIVLVIEDITQRARAEEALRESEERFRMLADNMSQFAWMADVTGWIFWYNQRWFDYTGTTLEEMQGWGWKKVHHPDHVDRVVVRIQQSWDTGELWEDTFPLRGRDGRYRWFLSRAYPIRDHEGRILRWFGTNTDITDQRQAEEALREAQVRLQRWTVELEQAVNIKTAELRRSQEHLRAMATELNLTEQRERKRLATELHDHLQQTLVLGKLTIGQGKRVAAALPACLDVMKKTDEIFSEALTYTRTLVSDLSPTVLRDHGLPEALQWLGAYMQKYNQTVTVTVPDDEDLKLPEDQVILLFQSVRELLINSSKHAGTGEATVRMEQRDGLLRIDVRDEGSGFDLAAAAAAAGTPSGGISSKFGLFSIKERMRALGGSFEIQSAPGKGTTATLVLPLAAKPSVDSGQWRVDSEEKRPPVTPTLTTDHWTTHEKPRIRVLLVDDHIMIRQGLRSVLNAYADIELVGEAGNGEEAVQLVEQMRPAVVVMDINMPKMNGIEATRKIRTRYPDIIVIGLSVNVGGENQGRMLEAGAALLLTKEAAVEELHEVVMRHVGRAKESDSSHPSLRLG